MLWPNSDLKVDPPNFLLESPIDLCQIISRIVIVPIDPTSRSEPSFERDRRQTKPDGGKGF